MTNPLFLKTPTPAFDQILPEHFDPAISEVLLSTEQEYISIRDNSDEPTFENTVVPFDTLFEEVGRILFILGTYTLNARNEQVVKIEEEAMLKLDSLSKKVFQDRVLGSRFKSVHDKKDELTLDDQDRWFLKSTYNQFEENGAFLDEAGQKKLQEIDANLIVTAQKCYNNSIDGMKQQAFLIVS